MAKHIGLVIFPDGEQRFLIFNGFVDKAWPELFARREDAEAAWEKYDTGEYDPFAISTAANTDDEPVMFFSWADNWKRDEAPDFMTTASRLGCAITGPLGLDDLDDEGPHHNAKMTWAQLGGYSPARGKAIRH